MAGITKAQQLGKKQKPKSLGKATKRSTKLGRPKLASRKKLIKELDKLVGDYIKHKYPRCVTCGTDQSPTNGHYITRSVYALRWHLPNQATQCRGCNLRHEYDSVPFTIWIVKTYGAEILEEFQRIRQNHTKFTTPDLRDLLDQKRIEIQKLLEKER